MKIDTAAVQLAAATEIADAGKRVILLDQEGEQSLGGQAFWSFGGLFLVGSPGNVRNAKLHVEISLPAPRFTGSGPS